MLFPRWKKSPMITFAPEIRKKNVNFIVLNHGYMAILYMQVSPLKLPVEWYKPQKETNNNKKQII